MSTSEAVEMTAQDIIPRLNKDTVSNLVLVSMLALPDSLPSHFHDTYTPIAAAGGQAQVVHLARLLATQMNAAKIGKGYEKMEELRKVYEVLYCSAPYRVYDILIFIFFTITCFHAQRKRRKLKGKLKKTSIENMTFHSENKFCDYTKLVLFPIWARYSTTRLARMVVRRNFTIERFTVVSSR